MAVFNDEFQAPEGLSTEEFLLRPIRATDAELDYEAVMESRDFLRVWEQSTWPADDFTVEANREDMVKLERRHADSECFTYTVMNPTETQCLGCVYILPTTPRTFAKAQIIALDGTQWSAYDVAFYFWIRKSRLADELDRRVLEALGRWIEREWQIDNYLVVTNEQFAQQVALIESAGFKRKFRLEKSSEPGDSLAYAKDSSLS